MANMMFAFQTFAINDMNKQREQINGICILFCAVAAMSFFSQFLQVCVTISVYNLSLRYPDKLSLCCIKCFRDMPLLNLESY